MEFYEQEVVKLLGAGKGRVATDDFFMSVKERDGMLSVSVFNTRGGTLEQRLRAGEFEVRTPVVSYYPGQVSRTPDLHYYYQGKEFKPSYDFIRACYDFFETLGRLDLSDSIADCVTRRLKEFEEDGYTCWSKDRALLLCRGEAAPSPGAEKLSFRKARKLWVTKETGGVSAINDVYRLYPTAPDESAPGRGAAEGGGRTR
ncbi:MAG: hypothetical protein LBT74_07955 [Acidobacteriota bacterium]|jgi:hypothetical protein|nr:hypothetical protein [Acidobacteriota bacterium]